LHKSNGYTAVFDTIPPIMPEKRIKCGVAWLEIKMRWVALEFAVDKLYTHSCFVYSRAASMTTL
jgi:hypothetical protein